MTTTTKRDFLKKAAFACVGLSLLAIAPARALQAKFASRFRCSALTRHPGAQRGLKRRLQRLEVRTVNDAFRLASKKSQILIEANN
jgi:hypothetical protein